jgi:hypothetical protein
MIECALVLRALAACALTSVVVRLQMGAKGWGLILQEDVKQGEFIVEYCGEVRACAFVAVACAHSAHESQVLDEEQKTERLEANKGDH